MTLSTPNHLLLEADVTLRRALAGRPFRPLLLVGEDTAAQTAYLADIALRAETLGFAVSRLTIRRGTPLRALLAPELDRVRHSMLPALPETTALMVPPLVDPLPEPLEPLLSDLFECLGEALRAERRGWLLLTPRLHLLRTPDLAALLAALHRISQAALPIVLVGTGTPSVLRRVGDAKPYAERLFWFEHG